MPFSLRTILLPAAALAVVALPLSRSWSGLDAAPPQLAANDPLALLLGDVRMLLGRRLVAKADEYFHGGVTDIACSHHHHHHQDGIGADEGDDPDEEGHGGEKHRESEDHEAEDHDGEAAAQRPVRAPWAFVTSAIRLPAVERHLEGEATREILPWLWAASRVDSANAATFANAAYVLDALYGDYDKALAALDEGIRANPKRAELEFQKGLLLLRRFHDAAAAEAAFTRALAKARDDAALDNRDDIDRPMLTASILLQLGRLARDRGDLATLRRRYDEARAVSPDHHATQVLRRLLEESGAAPAP